MNHVTPISMTPAVRRTRRRVAVAELPDFFAMIDRQASMVVDLARTVGDVLEGRESAHSVRLLELEQRRDELQRRSQAAAHSLPGLGGDVDEIRRTMEALDGAAARLLRTAHGCRQFRQGADETCSRMMAVIEKASASLQHGYARLANGSPAAAVDADYAIESTSALTRCRVVATPKLPRVPVDCCAREDSAGTMERTVACIDPHRDELHESLCDIAQELAGAGAILKEWSDRLSGRLRDQAAAAGGMCAFIARNSLAA